MIVLPAVDLRGGHAVQLVGGRPGTDRVRLPDPVAVASSWVAAGFRALHLVDLDAALGEGSNRTIVGEMLASIGVPIQVGGGVRDEDDVAALLEAGAARVIVGTRAIAISVSRSIPVGVMRTPKAWAEVEAGAAARARTARTTARMPAPSA